MRVALRSTIIATAMSAAACSSSMTASLADGALADGGLTEVAPTVDAPASDQFADGPTIDDRPDGVDALDSSVPSDASDLDRSEGASEDRFPGDGGAIDGPDLDGAPRCSSEVDPQAGQGTSLGYPRAVVIPFGGFSDAGVGATVELPVQWQGLRRLPTAVRTSCSVGSTSDPPCEIRDAVVLRADGGAQLEVLVSALTSDLQRIPLNTRMILQLASGDSEFNFRLLLTGTDGTIHLLIVSDAPGGRRYGPFAFSRAMQAPVCVSGRQPTCMRVLVSEPLAVSPADAAESWAGFTLAPMEGRLVNTSVGRYRVTHRSTVYSARSICSAPPISYSQFEVLRVGD